MLQGYSFKRGVCLTVQSTIYPFLVYEHIIHLCFGVIWLVHSFSSLFWNLVFRHANFFLREKSIRYSPFLFDQLCKQNLLFPFLLISWKEILKKEMMSVSLLALVGLLQKTIVVQGLPLNDTNFVPSWILSMLLSDFKVRRRRSIPTSIMEALTEFSYLDIKTNIYPLLILGILVLIYNGSIHVLVCIWCLYYVQL